MSTRNLITLGAIVVAVAGLGLLRSLSGPAERDANGGPQGPVETEAAARPALLDFGRGTCIPCQQMMPVLDRLADTHAGQVDVRYLDLSDPANQERAKELQVRIIPTQVLLAADGSEVGRHEGFWALDEIEARFEDLGWTPQR